MSKTFNGLDRIELLGGEIIALISSGCQETIEKVETEMEECNIVNYLAKKYGDRMAIAFDDNCSYNIQDWNKALSDYSGCIRGEEDRKYGIIKEDDGLLLLLALVMELLSQRK